MTVLCYAVLCGEARYVAVDVATENNLKGLMGGFCCIDQEIENKVWL